MEMIDSLLLLYANGSFNTGLDFFLVQVTLPTGTVLKAEVNGKYMNVHIIPSAADFNKTQGKF